jgi:hypothetical protein
MGFFYTLNELIADLVFNFVIFFGVTGSHKKLILRKKKFKINKNKQKFIVLK